MRWLFRLSHGRRELPEEVRSTLASRFTVGPEIMARALCVGKAGEGKCRVIRVYDPLLLAHKPASVKRYDDLAAQRHAILFEGRIDKDGSVYLADRRPPKTVTRRPSRITTPSPKPEQAS